MKVDARSLNPPPSPPPLCPTQQQQEWHMEETAEAGAQGEEPRMQEQAWILFEMIGGPNSCLDFEACLSALQVCVVWGWGLRFTQRSALKTALWLGWRFLLFLPFLKKGLSCRCEYSPHIIPRTP
jgi:hypothetical protein